MAVYVKIEAAKIKNAGGMEVVSKETFTFFPDSTEVKMMDDGDTSVSLSSQVFEQLVDFLAKCQIKCGEDYDYHITFQGC